MSATVLQLEQTRLALHEALDNSDWEAIGSLDLQCRQAVDLALADPHAPVEQVRTRMQELLDLYRDLVEACSAEQNRIAGELVEFQRTKKKAKVYQLFE